MNPTRMRVLREVEAGRMWTTTGHHLFRTVAGDLSGRECRWLLERGYVAVTDVGVDSERLVELTAAGRNALGYGPTLVPA